MGTVPNPVQTRPDVEPTCQECAANDCGQCTRPGGTRLADDDQRYPTCCCGRWFRSSTPAAGPEPQQSTQRTDPLLDAAGGIGRLAVHCGHWDARDRYRPGPGTVHPRAEASSAVETIDRITAVLRELRNTLITEVRRYDDESASRTDELLARLRSERETGR